MLNQIKSLIFNAGAGEIALSDDKDRVAAAAAALLIETAVMDGRFDAGERRAVTGLLSGRFGMDAAMAAEIIAEAEAAVAQSAGLFSFTRILRGDYDHAERVEMIEMMWEVAYADGVLHDYEANLIRRATGLLHVSDQESGAARKRVLERLDNEAGAA